MLTDIQAQDRATDLVARAIRAGADAADSVYVADSSITVQMRLGALEDAESSEGEDMALRVFVGSRYASASTSDLSADSLDRLAELTVAMAREAPEDPYAGLAPQDRLLKTAPLPLDLDDSELVTPEALKARALAAETAARGVTGVTNSEGASASAGRTVFAMATSHGFVGGYSGSSHGVSASVLAGHGGDMQRDYAYSSTRHLRDLDDAHAVGMLAGERAVARLSPVKLPSGRMPVVFDPRVSASLLGHLVGAITGGSIARKTSFLLDRLGAQIFAPGVTITDDPHRLRGLRSRPFDAEGLPTKRTDIVDDGRLTTWLIDSAAGRQLGLPPTGHATRGGAGTSNLHMAPGTLSRADLIADITDGLYVIELLGMGVNGLTGDYSRGAAGFRIQNGEITVPVAEVTIAGNLIDMFAAIVPANDLTFRYATNAPTLRIDGMMLAGG